MDEAEHCDSMSLIYQGSIIATGSPDKLKTDFMKGDVLKISLPNSQQWLDKLTALPAISETALFGSDIHAVVSDASTAPPLIKQFLDRRKVAGYAIDQIKPSLEDVFISLIENYAIEKSRNESNKS
jgi:ABC-2 type transport system ATP-binding protein